MARAEPARRVRTQGQARSRASLEVVDYHVAPGEEAEDGGRDQDERREEEVLKRADAIGAIDERESEDRPVLS
ncbi:hypothetical protein [Sorangium sp. So ce1000]|uniref:hypothetical protein n=1 Tax=Sorangium sp. So ce1000 TaxID=3133325 RepID=UPI003F5F3805